MPPAWEKMKRISRQRAKVPANSMLVIGLRGVEGKIERRGGNADAVRRAARRLGRMEIDHRLAAVEFLEHRRKSRIAGIFAVIIGQQADAVGLQLVQRIGDFAQAALDIGQRQAREHAEAVRDDRIASSWRNRCTRASGGAWSATSPNHRPGAEIEVIDFSMPLRSIASMECCGVHSGVLPATSSGPMRSSPTVRT